MTESRRHRSISGCGTSSEAREVHSKRRNKQIGDAGGAGGGGCRGRDIVPVSEVMRDEGSSAC